MSEIVQEPVVRFAPRVSHALLCPATRTPLDALACYCCTGFHCWLKDGCDARLLNDVAARPWYYLSNEAWGFMADGAPQVRSGTIQTMKMVKRQFKPATLYRFTSAGIVEEGLGGKDS